MVSVPTACDTLTVAQLHQLAQSLNVSTVRVFNALEEIRSAAA